MTSLDKPSRSVTRLTADALDGTHGKDRGRRLVCTMEFGDLLVLRPHGTRRSKTLRLADLYVYAIKCEANKSKMEKLRERLKKKQEAAERRRSRRIIYGK
jgi:hypothetical protein